MGHAAAKTRTAVLTTAAQSLQAVEEVRTLANALAAEQVALKAQLAAAEQTIREQQQLLEECLKKQGDLAKHAVTEIGTLSLQVTKAHALIEQRRVADEAIAGSLPRRLRWLVFGR